MTSLRIGVILATFLLTASLAGCGGGKPNSNTTSNANTALAANENPNSPKTNIEELGVIINVPYTAEDIVWKESPSHKKLTAVFRFSPADSDKIVAEAAKVRPPQSVTMDNETWYPDDLIAQGNISGDDTLKGTSYAANAFLQEPFNEGRVVRIEGTNYFILEATAR